MDSPVNFSFQTLYHQPTVSHCWEIMGPYSTTVNHFNPSHTSMQSQDSSAFGTNKNWYWLLYSSRFRSTELLLNVEGVLLMVELKYWIAHHYCHHVSTILILVGRLRMWNILIRRITVQWISERGSTWKKHYHRYVSNMMQHYTVYLFLENWLDFQFCWKHIKKHIQGGSNMTGTDLCVNMPYCAAAVRPWESEATNSTIPPARVRTCSVLSGSC